VQSAHGENARLLAENIFFAAVGETDPFRAVQRHADELRGLYREGGFTRLVAVGFGKAAFPMARAVEETLGDLLDAGVIITRYGHASGALQKFRIFEAGHPVPDANGEQGTREAIRLIEGATERTLVVMLISGGGSALLVFPCEGILLEEKRELTSLLLRAGADIGELNTVRKHLSRVKGGRLAELAFPATVASLILSDVIGNRLDVIASGPTAPDPTTYSDALGVLEKFRLLDRAPPAIVAYLEKGEQGLLAETPKPGSPVFRQVTNTVIASNRMALEAARRTAKEAGLAAEIIAAPVTGEAREAGAWLARKALIAKRQKRDGTPVCLISGGETTVTVTGSGTGGRSMELALAFAREIEGVAGITLLSAGTDGTDGPTDAAGAIVDGMTVTKGREAGADPGDYLRDNDSYHYFTRCGGLFKTGPTGTNVMDLQIVVIE
jgi:glycerate 2-kinase